MMKGMGGITITELIVTIAILSVLAGMAGLSLQKWQNQYQAESQIRQMHADMLKTRVRAFEQNKSFFVTITPNNYQVIEDTNESGESEPDSGDKIWIASKQLSYRCQWTGTIIVNARGLISTSTRGILSSSPVSVWFDIPGTEPEYDCLSIGPTRVLAGKWNGRKCIER